MYRRIMGFFGGAMSEGSEDTNQELNKSKTDENETTESSNLSASIMAAREQGALRDRIQNLERELKIRVEESENYKNKLQLVENELAVLQTNAVPPTNSKISTGVGDGIVEIKNDVSNDNDSESLTELTAENRELREALRKTNELLKDKTDLCDSQEKQNAALTNQIASLKEVVAITRDLLNIRNMEVQNLQSDVESMEGKIADERQRHNLMITKMDDAVKLNSELKKEYEHQLKLFQDLKIKYEEKVTLLTKENKKLENEVYLSKSVPNVSQNVQMENIAEPPQNVQMENIAEPPQNVQMENIAEPPTEALDHQ